jgi:hypothetical protein
MFLSRLFRRRPKPQPRKDASIFEIGGGWGDAIHWQDTENPRVVGWKTPMPREGDILVSPMESGKRGKFVFGKIEACGDPRDMFFASLRFLGYVE